MMRELEKSCRYLLHTILGLQRGDKLLLYTDESDGQGTAKAIQEISLADEISADLVPLQEFRDLPEKEAALLDKIAHGNYQALCELSSQYFYPSPVWRKAVRQGCRVLALGAMDKEAFVRCVGKVGHEKIYEFGLRLSDLLRKARWVEISSDSGAKISCQLSRSHGLISRIGRKLGLQANSHVWTPSGMFTPSIHATFMSGQVAFIGMPHSIQGTAVIDGSLWPPDTIGRLDHPLLLRLEKGSMISVEGSSDKAIILNQWLQGRDKQIKHFCIGFNPGARLSKNLVETERAFGHLGVGVGTFPFHTDGIIKNPTIVLDGTVLLQNQTFQDAGLMALSRELVVDIAGKDG